jgi:penicillin-binding protein 2
MHKSIVISCDTYYYGLAVDMGIDTIHDFLTRIGFGAKTGIDLEGELQGIAPSQEWKWQRFRQKWFTGDTVSVGIGQGYMLATPLQLAAAVATLANGGTPVHPRLLKGVQDGRTHEVRDVPSRNGQSLGIKPENLKFITAAMVDVTRPGGTAARASQGATYAIAAKTGTAQVIGMKQDQKYDEKRVKEQFRDHALFIAYAPADDPKLAMAILVENGGHGGDTAAPMARQVFDYYLLGKTVEKKPKLEPKDDEEND